MKHTRDKPLPTSRKTPTFKETVLMLPLVLIVLFGIGNFIFALKDRAQLVSASDEAARAGVLLMPISHRSIQPMRTQKLVQFAENVSVTHP